MLAPANPLFADELSMAALLDTLGQHRDKALIFSYEGRDVRPSYHVTEVKTGEKITPIPFPTLMPNPKGD